eukprot:TRINITY_DN2433_c0_g1_i4.p1 TRINITY_DN2433_c0_g1~~TRINITY_DN2433_c0_g1_i4.p1  ORF type:complete len:385 (+),score=52.04 TRINITY_DN2433_c0_g1_i4:63-1157(+)
MVQAASPLLEWRWLSAHLAASVFAIAFFPLMARALHSGVDRSLQELPEFPKFTPAAVEHGIIDIGKDAILPNPGTAVKAAAHEIKLATESSSSAEAEKAAHATTATTAQATSGTTSATAGVTSTTGTGSVKTSTTKTNITLPDLIRSVPRFPHKANASVSPIPGAAVPAGMHAHEAQASGAAAAASSTSAGGQTQASGASAAASSTPAGGQTQVSAKTLTAAPPNATLPQPMGALPAAANATVVELPSRLLTSPTSPGAYELSIASTAGLRIGDQVNLGEETRTIVGITPLLLDHPLLDPYDVGSVVMVRRIEATPASALTTTAAPKKTACKRTPPPTPPPRPPTPAPTPLSLVLEPPRCQGCL